MSSPNFSAHGVKSSFQVGKCASKLLPAPKNNDNSPSLKESLIFVIKFFLSKINLSYR